MSSSSNTVRGWRGFGRIASRGISAYRAPGTGASPPSATSCGWEPVDGVAAVGAWPQSYEAQVRAGYGGNAVAQRAVRLVAEAVGSAPLDASDPALLALVTLGQRLLRPFRRG